jgi:hypothetical protein
MLGCLRTFGTVKKGHRTLGDTGRLRTPRDAGLFRKLRDPRGTMFERIGTAMATATGQNRYLHCIKAQRDNKV